MEGDPLSERAGVTSQVYLEILKEHLPTILNPGDIFMQDGAGIHRARIIKQWFSEEGIELMDWPPYSPDLNPIENLWALLKEAIHKKYPELEFATKTDENLDLLGDAILCRLSDTMPKRVQAVLDAEGWYTKY
jgi:transposase